MKETEFIKQLELDIKDKLSHVSQIDMLEKIFVDMKKSFRNLDIDTTSKFTNPMKKIQIR